MLRRLARRTGCAACGRRLVTGSAAAPGGAASLAAQLVAYGQSRLAAGAHDEAAQVLEHGLTLLGTPSAADAGAADARACVQMALAAVASDRGRFAQAASLLSAAARSAASPALLGEERAVAHAGAGGDVARLALAGAAGGALHASGRVAAAAEAYGALQPEAVDARRLQAAALTPLAGALAAALHGAGVWHACHGGSSAAQALFESSAAAAHASCGTPADAASAPLLLSRSVASLVAADAALGLAQLALRRADADAAERHCEDALRLAEAVSGPAHARVAPVLAVSADAAMARMAAAAKRSAGGVLSAGASDGVYVAEALYRKALTMLATGAKGVGDADCVLLTALLQRRLAEVLRIAGPSRARESERLVASAAAADGVLLVAPLAARPWAKAPPGERDALLSLRLLRALSPALAD